MLQACPFQILAHMKQKFWSFQNAVNGDCNKAMSQILRDFFTFMFQIIWNFVHMKSGRQVIKNKYKKQKAHARYAISLRRRQITGPIIN